jgi:hypothetical protein
MFHDPIPTEVEAPQPPAPVAPSAEIPAPTAEQQQAADGVFSQENEARAVATILGVQTGLLLLHHLALETFQTPAEEEEPRRPPPPQADEPDPAGP